MKPDLLPSATNPSGGTWVVDRLNLFFYFRRMYRMLARRWFLLALSTVIGGTVAFFVARNTPNIYRAASRIGIAPRIQTTFTSQAQYLEELNNFYDSQIQYMTSSKVLGRVEEKVLPFRPTTPGFTLITQAGKNAGSFSMTAESTDFEYARRFVTIWAQEFVAFKRELREGAIGRTAASTRDEILRCERNLENARAALLQFQRQHNIGSIKETGDAAQQRLDKLEGEYQDIKTLRQRLESKTSEEIASGSTLPSALAPDRTPKSNERESPSRMNTDPLALFDNSSKYAELQLKLKSRTSELERQGASLKPKHPYMIRLQQDLAQINEELRFQLDLIEEKRLARIKSLRVDEQSYGPLIEDLRKQVLNSRNTQYQFERLQEEETNVKTLLDNLRKTQDSLASTTLDEGLFHIIEEGGGSPAAVRPDRPKMIISGVIVGLAIGFALVYLLGRLDDRFELAEEIEAALDEPVLGQVPLLAAKQKVGPRPLVTTCEEQQLFPEALRNVRSSILLGQEGPRQVLIMTSAVPGDGKTTMSVNFALTMAIAGHRVLLVDADLRRGDTHSFFSRSRDPGLADVLAGRLHWADVLQTTPVPNLHVIHTGKLPPNPGELLGGPILKEFLAEVRGQFDYVLLDCPPLTAIDDTFLIASLADGLMFVVRSGQTSMRFARNALDVLRQRGVRIMGLVLNGITPDNPYYYYKNYYYGRYAAETSGGLSPSDRTAPTKMAAAKKALPLPTVQDGSAPTPSPIIVTPDSSVDLPGNNQRGAAM